MHNSNFFEYGKDFTVFNVTPNNFAGTDQGRIELVLNGVPLVQGVEYDPPIIPVNFIFLIRNITKAVSAQDTLVVNIYNNSAHTTLQNSMTVPVYPRNAYVEVYGDYPNGILSTDTNDQSPILSTPLEILNCGETTVNGHYNAFFQFGVYLGGAYPTPILVNGVPMVASDLTIIDNPAVTSVTVDGTGKITTVSPNFVTIASKSYTGPLSIETTVQNSSDGIDEFTIDGYGFVLIGGNNFPEYQVIRPGADLTITKSNLTSTYKVERTVTAYNAYVNGVLVDTLPISVTYSSDRGTLVPSSGGVGTLADFTPTSLGSGAISANYSGLFAVGQRIIVSEATPVLVIPGFLNIDCSTTAISGTVPVIRSGTMQIKVGGTVIYDTPINGAGQWSFTGLDFSPYGGQQLEFLAVDALGNESCVSSIPSVQNLNCCTPPAITSLSPPSASFCSGGTVPLTVIATGTATLNYQWKKDGVNITQPNSATLNVTQPGSYVVEITNSCGTVTSDAVVVTEIIPPSVASGGTPVDGIVNAGYVHSIQLSGQQPFSLTSVSKPAWLNVDLVGDVVTLSGAPTVGNAGNNAVSFTIGNVCDAITLNLNIYVISANAVDDIYTTTANVPLVLNLSSNDIICN